MGADPNPELMQIRAAELARSFWAALQSSEAGCNSLLVSTGDSKPAAGFVLGKLGT